MLPCATVGDFRYMPGDIFLYFLFWVGRSANLVTNRRTKRRGGGEATQPTVVEVYDRYWPRRVILLVSVILVCDDVDVGAGG